MSDAVTHSVTHSVTTGAGLLASLEPLLRQWLPRQRWFAGRQGPVTALTPVAETELLPRTAKLGIHHLLVRVHQPSVPEGAGVGAEVGSGVGSGVGDCYQLLLGTREALPPQLAPALIGHAQAGPLAGLTVYDALHDPRATGIVLEALRTRARVGGLRFERAEGQEIPGDLRPRPVTTEQSNSSVVYGESFILKLLRRVVPGVNPDLELPLALAREGCDRVPAPAAWLLADLDAGQAPEPYVLAVLQPFAQDASDGWQLALTELSEDGGDFGSEARALGRATAEVHQALARALPTVTLGRPQLHALSVTMTSRLSAAAQAVPALRPYEHGLRSAFTALADLTGTGPVGIGSAGPAAGGRTWTAQRTHGDLHLGQCLRTPSGQWLLIDFEGEPSKPLAERRMPQPVARDVAGMLRSFDYAAHSVHPWRPDRAAACRAAYCAGYAEIGGHDPRHDPVLLRAFETDKAVYEVVYEARHRPDWLPVPLSAIRRLAVDRSPVTRPTSRPPRRPDQ